MSRSKTKHVAGASVHFLDPQEVRCRSMRKTVYNAGLEIQQECESLGGKFVPWFITLTYRRTEDWRANQIQEYLKRVRSWLHRRSIKMRYVWVAELQKRGAVHYHILLWVPKGLWIPYSDRQGWWKFGYTNSKPARKAIGYMMKYVSKGDTDEKFPRGCRIYGVGGLTAVSRRVVRYWKAPKWYRSSLPEGLDPATVDLRRFSGGWIDWITSQYYKKTPYRFFGAFKKAIVIYKIDDPEDFDYVDMSNTIAHTLYHEM